MTKEEMIERIKELKEQIWLHEMADRWDFWEAQEVEKKKSELRKLEWELKNK